MGSGLGRIYLLKVSPHPVNSGLIKVGTSPLGFHGAGPCLSLGGFPR